VSYTTGYTLGTLASAIEDIIGRLRTIILGGSLMCVGCFASAVMPEIYSLAVCQIFAGLGAGIFEVSMASYISEVNSIELRAKFFVMNFFNYLIGTIMIIAIAFAIIPGMDPTYWYILMVIAALPAVVGIIIAVVYLKESPRFLLNKERFDDAADACEFMLAKSNRDPISEIEL
jgi:MFS family permease